MRRNKKPNRTTKTLTWHVIGKHAPVLVTRGGELHQNRILLWAPLPLYQTRTENLPGTRTAAYHKVNTYCCKYQDLSSTNPSVKPGLDLCWTYCNLQHLQRAYRNYRVVLSSSLCSLWRTACTSQVSQLIASSARTKTVRLWRPLSIKKLHTWCGSSTRDRSMYTYHTQLVRKDEFRRI